MTKYNKYILLYTVFTVSLLTIFYFIDQSKERNIKHQQNILVQEAKSHFLSQSNTREWNDQYLGVYVLSEKLLQPHPYLPNSTLKTDANETLFRINHASMARQLSEISDQDDLKFHLTSLDPLNPLNKAGDFEKRALKYIEKHKIDEYYEFNVDNFRYLGAILTEQKCLECHAHQGYELGDVRGGMSVTLSNENYVKSIDEIEDRNLVLKIAVFLFLSLITMLMHKQIMSNQVLMKKVEERTKEIEATKELLQNVLDADESLMVVSSGTEVILANKTTLKFLEVDSLERFREHYEHISDVFEHVDDETYLKPTMNGEHWINYLHREQYNTPLKVMIKRHGKDIHLKVHSKEIQLHDQSIHIIFFDDITEDLKMIESLKNEATRDPLTQLFNRGKFNQVLAQEIVLAQTTGQPLSIIFLDIDHFKKVNDTYGHDIGDEVIVQIANILSETIRKGDFVARWGGEEFVITLQANSAKQAAVVAEKLRLKTQEHNFGAASKQTISLGVTQYKDGEEAEEFIRRVDTALYEAKETGRNKVVVKLS